jgi:hypothetical protein
MTWHDFLTTLAFVPVDHIGICLRDKGLARPGSTAPNRPTGVTALALDPLPDLFAHWSILLAALGPGYWDSELFRQPPTVGTTCRTRSASIASRLTGIKVAPRRGLDQTANGSAEPRLAALRASLERRWGIGDRLEQLERTLDQLERTLRAYTDQRAARLVTFLTVFGFPLVLFAGFFDFALNGMPWEWDALPGWLLGQSAPAVADAANSGPQLARARARALRRRRRGRDGAAGAGPGPGPPAGRARALTGPLCGSSLARTRTGKVRTADYPLSA